MITWVLLACAHRPSVTITPVSEVVHQFSVSARGRTLAGLSVLQLEDQRLDMDALTPVGSLLFSVQMDGEATEVRAASPQMEPLLRMLPFYRDMALVYLWRCPEGRCTAPTGRVCESRDGDTLVRRYRGKGGPAQVQITEGRAVIKARRRGYTLTLLGEQIHAE